MACGPCGPQFHLPRRMDHLPVAFGRGLGASGVQVGRGAGHGHGHIGASLALLENPGGGAQQEAWPPVPLNSLAPAIHLDTFGI